jgi:hypothetical protein
LSNLSNLSNQWHVCMLRNCYIACSGHCGLNVAWMWPERGFPCFSSSFSKPFSGGEEIEKLTKPQHSWTGKAQCGPRSIFFSQVKEVQRSLQNSFSSV